MSLGKKEKLTGTIRLDPKEGALFYASESTLGLKILVRAGNATYDPAVVKKDEFDSFIGRTVTVEGVRGSGRAALFIEGLDSIIVLPTRTCGTKPPQRPPQP